MTHEAHEYLEEKLKKANELKERIQKLNDFRDELARHQDDTSMGMEIRLYTGMAGKRIVGDWLHQLCAPSLCDLLQEKIDVLSKEYAAL